MRSLSTALAMGKGSMMVLPVDDAIPRHFSRALMCPTTGISYPEPEPNLFSFNSPYGACPTCNGLGQVAEADRELIIPDETKNLRQGGLAPLGALKAGWTRDVVRPCWLPAGTLCAPRWARWTKPRCPNPLRCRPTGRAAGKSGNQGAQGPL